MSFTDPSPDASERSRPALRPAPFAPAPCRPAAADPADAPGDAPGDTSVELRLAPRFVASQRFLAQLPAFVFLAAWGGGLFGGFAHIVLGLGGRGVPGFVPFVGAGLALAILLPASSLCIGRRAYRATTYVVGDGRLHYDEGFVALERRTLELGDVTLVRLRQGRLQRRHGLGTLILTVAARTGQRTPAPVRLFDVPEPERALARLRELVAGSGPGHDRVAGRSQRVA